MPVSFVPPLPPTILSKFEPRLSFLVSLEHVIAVDRGQKLCSPSQGLIRRSTYLVNVID